jgi:hypothetical protein
MRHPSADGDSPSAGAQLDLTNPGLHTDLGIFSQVDSTGSLQHIDVPADDFTLLAAFGPSLRQFLIGITPWSRGNSRTAPLPRDLVRTCE